MNHKFVLTVDLKDDAALIAAYDEYHQNVWPEIIDSIRDSGIVDMQIYRVSNRLVMIMETGPDHDPAAKAAADRADPSVRAWEERMDGVQRPLPWAAPDAKWTPASPIFSLDDQP